MANFCKCSLGVSMEGIFSVCRIHNAILSLILTWLVIWFRSSVSLSDLWLMIKPWTALYLVWFSLFSSGQLALWKGDVRVSLPSFLSSLCIQVVDLGSEPSSEKRRVARLQAPTIPGLEHRPTVGTSLTLLSLPLPWVLSQAKTLARPFWVLSLALKNMSLLTIGEIGRGSQGLS